MQDLAGKCLIKGFPADGKFLGGQTLTRYEMATIIERVLQRIDELVKSTKAPKPQSVSKSDVDKIASSLHEIRDLSEEFKKELLVIGSDLKQAQDDIAALKTQTAELSAQLTMLNGKVDDAAKTAAAAKLASEHTSNDLKQLRKDTDTELEKKVTVGISPADLAKKYNLRLFGDVQTWYLNAPGSTAGGQASGSSAPAGRNYGGGVGDTFRLRRAEIGVTGNIAPKTDFYVLIDFAKIPNLSSNSSTVSGTSVVTSVGANATNDVVQEAWAGYQLNSHARLQVGAEKTGMTEEGNRSSVALYTIERSIMNGLPTNGGRVGYVRDTGAILSYKIAQGNVSFGVFNDNGAVQNNVDNDRTKFANVVANYTGIRNLIAGVFGGTNVDNVHPKPSRDRAGYTILYKYGRNVFESEGAYTLDQSAVGGLTGRSIGLGGYALYGYSLSKKWQLVAKIDEWNPSVHGSSVAGVTLGGPSNHNLNEYTFGLNYYLNGNNNKIQLNYIDEDGQHNGIAFWGIRRQLILTNYSIGF